MELKKKIKVITNNQFKVSKITGNGGVIHLKIVRKIIQNAVFIQIQTILLFFFKILSKQVIQVMTVQKIQSPVDTLYSFHYYPHGVLKVMQDCLANLMMKLRIVPLTFKEEQYKERYFWMIKKLLICLQITVTVQIYKRRKKL